MVHPGMMMMEAVLLGAFGGALLRQVATTKPGKPRKGVKGQKPDKPTRATL